MLLVPETAGVEVERSFVPLPVHIQPHRTRDSSYRWHILCLCLAESPACLFCCLEISQEEVRCFQNPRAESSALFYMSNKLDHGPLKEHFSPFGVNVTIVQ